MRFIGSCLDDLKNFPAEARRKAGYELDAVQRGAIPIDFKPLLTSAPALMSFASMR
jgi:phage-related protein